MRAMSLAIVGADFPNKRGPTRRFELRLCIPGEPVELRPEPKNPADEHAIAVYSVRGVQLGYIPSQRAVFVGKLMREGHNIAAIFQAEAPFGGWCRIAFDGETPVLPVQRDQEPEQDWWPDEMWPEE